MRVRASDKESAAVALATVDRKGGREREKDREREREKEKEKEREKQRHVERTRR